MSDTHPTRKSSPKETSSITYECTNCGTKQSLEELSRLLRAEMRSLRSPGIEEGKTVDSKENPARRLARTNRTVIGNDKKQTAIYFYERLLRYTVKILATGYAEVDNGLLYYETAGKGPALVLIQAGFLDSRMWDDQFELFSKTHKVIRYDVRGFGKSDIATSEFSNYSDLHALLEHLRVESASLLGISMGGRIALDFAVEHPKEVQSLILVSPRVSGYRPSDPEEQRLWKEFDATMKPQEEATREGRAEDVVRMDLEAWAPLQNQASNHRLREIALYNFHVRQEMPWKFQVDPDPLAFEILSDIRAPTLFIVGDRDVPAQTLEANKIHSHMPGSQWVVIPRADHIASLVADVAQIDTISQRTAALQ